VCVCVCVMEAGCTHICAHLNYSLSLDLRPNEPPSEKGLEDISVSCVELAEGDLGGTGVDNYWGSTLVRAR